MGLFIVEIDLKSRSPTTVENGDVIVDKGYSTITIRNVEADTHVNAEKKAWYKANDFLNELSWQYGIQLELGSGSTIAPQESSATRHLKRIYIKTSLKGWHRRKYPRVLKEIIIKPSDSKALYRKAAISQDSRDKFRELFLVIENIASKMVKDWHNHKELIQVALQKCFHSRLHELEDFISQYGFKYGRDIIDEIASELYENYRIQLFHAKANKDKIIPFKPEDDWKVQRILPLADYIAKALLSYEDTNLLT